MSDVGLPMSQWPSIYDYTLPPGSGAEVTVTIDGRPVTARAGDLVIRVAQEHGTYIPRFCWHERMKPVGMCRMCLVEVDGMRGLQISCATTITDGMVVHTQSPGVREAQDGVLELLLINHPLDCPVCDRGGECPLQDQTLAFGPGESRFVEEKRHWEKPTPISDLVLLDRERCIQCGRCTRFAAEIAGDPLIDFGGRGNHTEVITYPDDPFTSYFSGNTVQICPVGALTARPFRFRARPWDLTRAETSCVTCSVQCRGELQSTSNRIVRLLGVDSEPVNHGWLCDKGRYGYERVHAESRSRSPMVRDGNGWLECSWPEALDAAVVALRRAVDLAGPAGVAVLGGARGTNEDAYAWARLAKGVLRTDHVDAQPGDGLPADVVLGMPRATIADCDRAAGIVWLGPDLKEELPVLALRVRRAVVDLGVPLVDLAPRAHGLSRHASAVIRTVPGEEGEVARRLANALSGAQTGDRTIDAAAAAVAGRDGPIVVLAGRTSVAQAPDSLGAAIAVLAANPRVRFLSALRRGNVHGALDLGLAPGFLPGRVTLDSAREWFTDAWGGVPESPGLDAAGILRAAADGRVHALVLLGADPLDDFPDRRLATSALAAVGSVVAVGTTMTASTRRADVFLPTSTWGERTGSATNLEGRVQRLGAIVSPDGITMPDWRIAAELALRLGVDFNLETPEEIQEEIARLAPAYAGVTAALLRRARDGAVVPLAEHPDELDLGPARIPVTDLSWEPIRPQAAEIEVERAEQAGDTEREADAAAAEADAEQLGEAPTSPGLPVPELHRGVGRVGTPGVPPRDAYALRLVSGRRLYDAGRVVTDSPSLAGLAEAPVLLINPADRDRIGVADGGDVRVTGARGSLVVPVRGDAATPVGISFLAFHQQLAGAAELIDVGAPVTDLRVERAR